MKNSLFQSAAKPSVVQRNKGWSLVDLMVGMALSLVVCAAGGGLMAAHLKQSRALVLEARLMQDLGAAQDLIVRSLRRSGFGAESAGAAGNPYTVITADPVKTGELRFSLSLDAKDNHRIDSNEELGFRLRDGVLQMLMGDAGWQAVSDVRTLRITTLQWQPEVQVMALSAHCAWACAASASSTCIAPQLAIRSIQLTIQAQSTHDAQVVRSLQNTIRVRNDAVSGACPV
jgi:prepilin peptidase dependent protein B